MQSFNLPSWLVYSPTYYLVVIDLQGNYSYTNPYFNFKFKHISNNFIGVDLKTTINLEDYQACEDAVKKCLENDDIIERVYIRKPNEEKGYFWTSWDFSLYKNENNEPIGILCIGHDITDLKDLSELSKKSEKKILHQIAIMENIAWHQSHIVRKPLANILGLINLITDEEDPEQQETMFKLLKDSSEELDEVVKNIGNKIHEGK